jgi:hypothetical protein
VALVSTQPLIEMSTRLIPGARGWPASEDDLTVICEAIVYQIWKPRRLSTLWVSRACYRRTFAVLSIEIVKNSIEIKN